MTASKLIVCDEVTKHIGFAEAKLREAAKAAFFAVSAFEFDEFGISFVESEFSRDKDGKRVPRIKIEPGVAPEDALLQSLEAIGVPKQVVNAIDSALESECDWIMIDFT